MTVIHETDSLLRSLRGIWDEEAVDEFDHALQSAARAIEDGADDELVLAAALHDLAHSPQFDETAAARHDATAREWLTPRFGARVGWLAGAHVAAKRYLVATDQTYGATLTATSMTSLLAQGGAGIDADFLEHPWWSDALRLRRYDDAAKVPGARAASVAEVLVIAERVVSKHESDQVT